MNFGSRLKDLRTSYKITQNQLAYKLGTSKSNISKYESGDVEPNINTLIMLSKYFHVSIDYLLLGDKNEYFRQDNVEALSWDKIVPSFPNAINATSEEKDIIDYYRKLSLKDKRWIMGQIIDRLERYEEDEKAKNIDKKKTSGL